MAWNSGLLAGQVHSIICIRTDVGLVARYLEVLLRRVSTGHIVYSPNHKAFVSLSSEGQLPFNAEEYADLMGKYFFYWFYVTFKERIWLFQLI